MARVGFGGKRGAFWVIVSSWLIPLMMAMAYVILIGTSEVDATGAAWEAIAFAFVVILWFMFRVLTEHAALGRAVDVGDADRILELCDFQMRRLRLKKSKRPYYVYRALALSLRGDHTGALVELDRAEQSGSYRALAATVRVTALAELGRADQARAVFDKQLKTGLPRDIQIDILARLADAQLRLAEGDRAGAQPLLEKLSTDVRAGIGIRERAKALAARA